MSGPYNSGPTSSASIPELIPELPKDIFALEWNYEAGYDFLGKTKPYAEAGHTLLCLSQHFSYAVHTRAN